MNSQIKLRASVHLGVMWERGWHHRHDKPHAPLVCLCNAIVMVTGRAVELVAFSACMSTLKPVAFLAKCAFATRVQVQYATSTQRLGTSSLLVRFGFLFGTCVLVLAAFGFICFQTYRRC